MTQYLSDREQLIALWREAFGDSREDIEAFLKNLFSKENYFCKKRTKRRFPNLHPSGKALFGRKSF